MPRYIKKEPASKICETCGTEFKTKFPNRAKYCSAVCRVNAWNSENSDTDLLYAMFQNSWAIVKDSETCYTVWKIHVEPNKIPRMYPIATGTSARAALREAISKSLGKAH